MSKYGVLQKVNIYLSNPIFSSIYPNNLEYVKTQALSH